jgi:hypothetical protein
MLMSHHYQWMFANENIYSDKNNERKDKSTLSTRCRRNSSGRKIRVDGDVLTDGSIERG